MIEGVLVSIIRLTNLQFDSSSLSFKNAVERVQEVLDKKIKIDVQDWILESRREQRGIKL